MAAYDGVYDSRHLLTDCQEPGLAPEPSARQSSMGYLYLLPFNRNPKPQPENSKPYLPLTGADVRDGWEEAVFRGADIRGEGANDR